MNFGQILDKIPDAAMACGEACEKIAVVSYVVATGATLCFTVSIIVVNIFPAIAASSVAAVIWGVPAFTAALGVMGGAAVGTAAIGLALLAYFVHDLYLL